jgi:hypothetical protein
MKAYGEVVIEHHAFFILALDGTDDCFTPAKNCNYPLNRGLVWVRQKRGVFLHLFGICILHFTSDFIRTNN